jgi:hypothetical protein
MDRSSARSEPFPARRALVKWPDQLLTPGRSPVNANCVVLCTIQNCMLTPPAADQFAVSCTPLT